MRSTSKKSFPFTAPSKTSTCLKIPSTGIFTKGKWHRSFFLSMMEEEEKDVVEVDDVLEFEDVLVSLFLTL